MAGPFRFDGARVIKMEGADILAPLVGRARRAGDDATTAANAANANADRAELAQDGATAAANMYATTTAGLAATAPDGFFTVVGDGTNTYAILYQKVGGAAVEQARYASKAAYEGPGGAGLIGYRAAGAGSVSRTMGQKAAETVSVRDFGADPTGVTSSSAAFARALAAGRRVTGAPGDVYLLDTPVILPAGRELIGNGASIKIAPLATAIRLSNDSCKVEGWTFIGNGGLYAVLDTGEGNKFADNTLTENIGHFYFATGARDCSAVDNRIIGRSASTEITTAIVFENCKKITAQRNRSTDIPVGWCIQIRNGSRRFNVSGNNILQNQYSDTKIATTGQAVFTFTLTAPDGYQSPCFLKKVQLNGVPSTTGYTVTGSGPTYTVTFDVGRIAGVEVKLVGYRGAENIQVNTGSAHGSIVNNVIDGTADSGIVLHGSHITCSNNEISNTGYAGIAQYGDQDNIAINGNTFTNCSQMDDGGSSPDFPDLASAFGGGLLLSGNGVACSGNVFVNTQGTMRYGIRVNKSDMAVRANGTGTMNIGVNTFIGSFRDGEVFAPNDTTGQRVNSVQTDGPMVSYPEQINTDLEYVVPPIEGTDPPRPAQPRDTLYFTVTGSDGVRAIRDQATKRGGVASLRTVAGQYIDFVLTGAAMLFDSNVEVTFCAKSNGGLSYFQVFSRLAGLRAPLTVEITDTEWRTYTVRLCFTPNLDPNDLLIRMGANSESANFQHIQITGRRL